MKIRDWMDDAKYKEIKADSCLEKPFDSLLFNELGERIGAFGTPHSTSLFTHTAILRYLFELNDIFRSKKPVFLDLGSGVGNLVIYAAKHGWRAYGVDISKDCHNAAIENLRKAVNAGYITKDNIVFKHCDFFPEGFKIEEMPGDKKEDDFREYLKKHKAPNFSQRLVGIGLGDVDLFYHYQVERRQNILNLFSKFAKKGALLAFAETREDSFVIPKNVIKLDYFHGMTIYQKI